MNIIDININLDNLTNRLSSINKAKIREAVEKIFEKLNIEEKEISLYFCNNEEIQKLNKDYRNKNYPTDVLSFESGEDVFLGDIAISIEKADEQKTDFDSPTLDAEILRLLIHGILHLLGYDHEENEKSAYKMYNLEQEIYLEVEKLTLF